MVLMSQHRITRSLQRMAFEILEVAGDRSIMLIGINIRGYAVAVMLRDFLQNVHSGATELVQMDANKVVATVPDAATPDATNSDATVPDAAPDTIPINTNGSVLVFVDDVIFSGLTIYRAMLRTQNMQEAENVLVAALVDRGHRRIPIRADVTGMHVPTKLNEHIQLQLRDDKPYEVLLMP